MYILITNRVVGEEHKDKTVIPMSMGYNIIFTPLDKPSGYIKVVVDSNPVDGAASRTQEYNLSPMRYELWQQSNYDPLVLCLAILHVVTHDYDQFRDIMRCYHENYTSTILEMIIENCCACGAPEMVLKTIAEILESFLGHPKGRNMDIDIYRDGGTLGLAYVLDANGRFIEHGGSIGGSWLEPTGVVLALAIDLESKSWDEE